jgi:hypothetical protein
MVINTPVSICVKLSENTVAFQFFKKNILTKEEHVQKYKGKELKLLLVLYAWNNILSFPRIGSIPRRSMRRDRRLSNPNGSLRFQQLFMVLLPLKI